MTEAGEYHFFAGWRSDPFFFDTEGALNNLQFTGTAFFTGKDVCSISGTWIQPDRGARPSRSIFLTGEQQGAYLAGEPADDARFVPIFAHSLGHTGGYSPDEAKRVATTLLPDILAYDQTRPGFYPSNGRALSDDVMDVSISLITNSKQVGDGVGVHHDLLAEFLTSDLRTIMRSECQLAADFRPTQSTAARLANLDTPLFTGKPYGVLLCPGRPGFDAASLILRVTACRNMGVQLS